MPQFARSSDGTRIAFEVHGTGLPALVLVHGWSCDRKCWTEQLAPLSEIGLVTAIDLAGHGESDATRREWSMAMFGADVAAVVNDIAVTDVILVGHSMGADVVLEASLQLRDRVRGLIWIDQYDQLSRFLDEAQVRERVDPFGADFVGATRAFVRRMFSSTADPSLVERVAMEMSSAPRHIALATLENTWNHGRSVPIILAQLSVPVVAINSQSASAEDESMRRLGVEVRVMRGVGHFPMMERTHEFNGCLTDVIKGFIQRDRT